MGQKINPVGFRIGISKDWKSNWFADKSHYADYALLDSKIRKLLQSKLSRAGLHSVEIERSLSNASVRVKVARPGMVIGRGGSGAEDINKELAKIVGQNVNFEVQEFREADTSAKLVAENVARQIERRISYKRAMNVAADKAMDRGIKGIKIVVSGVIGGASSIGRTEKVVRGSIPLQTLRADLDFHSTFARTGYGTIGVKVWVYKGETEL